MNLRYRSEECACVRRCHQFQRRNRTGGGQASASCCPLSARDAPQGPHACAVVVPAFLAPEVARPPRGPQRGLPAWPRTLRRCRRLLPLAVDCPPPPSPESVSRLPMEGRQERSCFPICRRCAVVGRAALVLSRRACPVRAVVCPGVRHPRETAGAPCVLKSTLSSLRQAEATSPSRGAMGRDALREGDAARGARGVEQRCVSERVSSASTAAGL